MAVNLELIKKKIAQLSGNRTSAFLKLPKQGELKLRILPWGDLKKDGTVFHERYFYYNLRKGGVLTPHQFGKPDPVQELIKKLREENTEDTLALAKKLYPNMRAFAPVIVRGEEDKGVRVWSFGKEIYERLLGFYVDEDVAEVCEDITNTKTGLDLKLKVSTKPGKMYPTTTVDAILKPCPLSKDANQEKEWLSKIPKIDDLYQEVSEKELEKILNEWLEADKFEGGEESTPVESTNGSSQAEQDLNDVLADLEKDE